MTDYQPLWKAPEGGGWNGLAVLRAQAREEYRDGLFKLPTHRLVDICIEDDDVLNEIGHALAIMQRHMEYFETQIWANPSNRREFARYTSHDDFRRAMERVQLAMHRHDQHDATVDTVCARTEGKAS